MSKDEVSLNTIVKAVKEKFGVKEEDVFGLFLEKEFKEKLDDNEDFIATCDTDGTILKLFVMHKVIESTKKPEIEKLEKSENSKKIDKIIEKVLTQDLFIKFTNKQLKKEAITPEDFLTTIQKNLKEENFQKKLLKILQKSLKN